MALRGAGRGISFLQVGAEFFGAAEILLPEGFKYNEAPKRIFLPANRKN